MAELEFILEVPDKGRIVAFPARTFVIGSGADCQLCFKAPKVAPRHAEIFKDERGAWWVRDLVGSGLVIVNDKPVIDERLTVGDRLRVGDVILGVRSSGVNALARTRSGETAKPVDVPEGELQPDTVIDNRYKILKRIAAGGMGEVYRAVHVELGKPLALKVMLHELSGDPDFVGRFKREAIASSRIGQQNIIDISDFGRTADGRFYFVMEYVDGKTLVKHRKEGPFPFQRVVHVGLQIARALAAAHAAGIIHRDLKPDNIMLVQRPGQPDFVKVLDFGIAKVQSASGASAKFTAVGSVVGTPQYMAPEQASAMPCDARSDIYALGLILHELVCGRQVYQADSAVQLMSMQVHAPVPPLSSPHGQVPHALERIINQMLAKVPEQRPASMEAVIAALEAIASFPTPTARTAPIPVPAMDDPSLARTRIELGPVPGPAATRVQPPSDPGQKTAMLDADRTGVIEPSGSVTIAESMQSTASTRPGPAVSGPETQSATELAALKPNRTPLVIGGLVLVIVLIGGALFALRPSEGVTPPPRPAVQKPVAAVTPPAEPVAEPTPTPKPAPASDVVKLTLESLPDRAEVFEDDILLGATPLTLSRPAGTLAAFRFESKGYQPLTRKVRFEAETTLKLELEKAAVKPKAQPKTPRPGGDDLMDLPE